MQLRTADSGVELSNVPALLCHVNRQHRDATCTFIAQGVRPAGLGKVSSRELADFIAVCIRPKDERPRSRQLLKHPYFDSIRERAISRAEALSATASQVLISSIMTCKKILVDTFTLPTTRLSRPPRA
jgi:hypothetical protein